MKPQNLGGVIVEKFDDGPDFPWALTSLWANPSPELIAETVALYAPRDVTAATQMIRLALHTFLVRTKHHLILIDTCYGNDKQRPKPVMHMRKMPYLQNLRALGVSPEQIDFIFCTHLHADHVGWNTILKDGRWVPTFPNAKYVMLRKEYDHWLAESRTADPGTFMSGSFADSVLPVMAAKQAVLVDEADHVCDHIRLEHLPGHSPGNAIVHITGNAGAAVCSGDVIHSPAQLRFIHELTAKCDDPVLSRANRNALLERLADTPTLLMPAHFMDPTAGRVIREGGHYGYRYVD